MSSTSSKLLKVFNSAPDDPKGRHLVALVDINAGKCVLQEEAYAWVLTTDNIEQRCHCCSSLPPSQGEGAPLSRCSGCHLAYYIDRKHQQRAWKAGHREECPVLAAARAARPLEGEKEEPKAPQLPPTIFRLALQVILKAYKAGELHLMADINHEATENATFLHDSEVPCGFPGVLSLLTHWPNTEIKEANTADDNNENATSSSQQPIPTSTSTFAASLPTLSNNAKIEFAQLAAWLYSLLQTTHPQASEIITPKHIALILARLSCNAHSMCDDELRVYGLGIYPLTAMANHSCEPNCVQTFGKNGRVALRTVRPVGAGEELTIAYVELAAVRWERRHQLLKSYCFDIDASSIVNESGGKESMNDGGLARNEKEEKITPEPQVLKDHYGNVIHHFHHQNCTDPPWKHDSRDTQLTSIKKNDLNSRNSLSKIVDSAACPSVTHNSNDCGAWGQIIDTDDKLKGFVLDEEEQEQGIEERRKEETHIEIHTWSSGNGDSNAATMLNEGLDSFVITYSEALYTLQQPSNLSTRHFSANIRVEKLKMVLKTLTMPRSQGVLLGSRHILRLRLLAELLHAFIESGEHWDEALCIARELFPLYEDVYPCPKWPPLVLLIATLAKLENFVGDVELSKTYAKRVITTLDGLFELGSPVVCKEMERLLYSA